MIVDFSKIPDEGKLWIFPSSRKFYPQEIEELIEGIGNFLSTWTSNNSDFNCAFKLEYNRFIVVAVDDVKTKLSLKAHDELIGYILLLEKKYNNILLDKINVCYKQGEHVQYKELPDFKKMIKNRGVSEKTTVFNNLVTTVEEYKNNWEINIMDSWLDRFL
ncbi:ABC transporter ATPase [uncultured Lutibacter sp.]|uniref:ABC transporter ATPase n=1 Tax=uncultured Lutibacter sp. TaxID=437739 RepID=UPI00262A46C8|nr:ABC transporter ATPase [uncultured Lutibacter sp.]